MFLITEEWDSRLGDTRTDIQYISNMGGKIQLETLLHGYTFCFEGFMRDPPSFLLGRDPPLACCLACLP